MKGILSSDGVDLCSNSQESSNQLGPSIPFVWTYLGLHVFLIFSYVSLEHGKRAVDAVVSKKCFAFNPCEFWRFNSVHYVWHEKKESVDGVCVCM